MRFEQVQRFVLAKKIFWGQGTIAKIPPGLEGKIVKNRVLTEPIRSQDLDNCARSSQTWKKNKN